ncbi:MAG TPA: 2-phosphosulfolactate phosphatase [Terriglobia bacterium]|nr:2-phosphosulfolactate phosphatase [Terriglobia bacterium]
MRKRVVIDSFPESVQAYRHGYAIVAVDVIRATTSAITAAALGGRCFPVASIDAARDLATKLKDPLLAGELGGERTPGFEINNSPAELSLRTSIGRPVILLSSSGTKLIHEAEACNVVYLACFRNYRYAARHLIDRYARVAVIGAGSRGEFRKEDQVCCAWIAKDLMAAGYLPENNRTIDLVDRWAGVGPEAALNGKSADYLRRSGQTKDLQFIFTHINDLDAAYVMKEGELIAIPAEELQPIAAQRSAGGEALEAGTAC